MGYEHYLRRDDNRTLFELGKWLGEEWMEALGGGAPIVLGPEDEDELALAITPDIETWGTLGPEFPRAIDYAIYAAKAIIAWGAGQPFLFIGEDGFDSGEMDDTWNMDQAITGSRYMKPPVPQNSPAP